MRRLYICHLIALARALPTSIIVQQCRNVGPGRRQRVGPAGYSVGVDFGGRSVRGVSSASQTADSEKGGLG